MLIISVVVFELLQATGWNEYCTCPIVQIWKYGYVYACLRDSKPVDVTLVEVPVDDAELLWGDGSTVKYGGCVSSSDV